MKSPIIYRLSSALLLLFAIGHTVGFRQSDSSWGVDALLGSMRSMQFEVQGFRRSYWDLFTAAGFTVGVFYFFAAILAWQLAKFPAENLVRMRIVTWAFAACFLAISAISCLHLFLVPIVFSLLITIMLGAAAWFSGKKT